MLFYTGKPFVDFSICNEKLCTNLQKVQRTDRVKDSQHEEVQQEKAMNLLIRNQPSAEEVQSSS